MNLAVFGDSWSCGAWSTPDMSFIPSGDGYFTQACMQYFVHVHNPFNAGGSNETSVQNLIRHINSKDYLLNTKILFIQTDPLRSLALYNALTSGRSVEKHVLPFFACKPEYQLAPILRMNVEMLYEGLSIVANRYNVIVNLVGGLSDVDSCVHKYPGINVVCESWLKLIEPTYVPSIFSTFNPDIDLNCMNKNDYDEMLVAVHRRQTCMKKLSGEYFGWGNDYQHPSKKGIDLLLTHIHDKLLCSNEMYRYTI